MPKAKGTFKVRKVYSGEYFFDITSEENIDVCLFETLKKLGGLCNQQKWNNFTFVVDSGFESVVSILLNKFGYDEIIGGR